MKKLFLAALIVVGIMVVPISASAAINNVTVVLPTYKCIINNSDIYFNDSQYPILSYKDITYFPMTWNYCRAMDLVTGWVDGQGLYIASKPNENKPKFQVYPLNKNVKNKSKMTATKVTYPVYIDGEKAPVDKTYPLLNFRGITYFPMTWTYAHDMFGWDLNFQNRVFTVETLPDSSYSCICAVSAEENGIYYLDSPIENLYCLDYATGKITSEKATKENRDKHFSSKAVTDDVSDKVSLKGNLIYFGESPMSEFKALAEGKAAADDVDLYASEETINGVTYLVIRAYYQLNVPAPYTPVEVYNYIKCGSEYKFISSDSEVINVGRTDTDAYVEVRYRTGFKSWLYSYSVVYKMDSNGNIECLNGLSPLFTDYHSISLIGIANNKAYLKCLWDPEANDGAASDSSNFEGYVSVSPVNDGFFTYDGKNLKQIHKYIFSDNEVVSKNGDVYIVNNYRGILKKI